MTSRIKKLNYPESFVDEWLYKKVFTHFKYNDEFRKRIYKDKINNFGILMPILRINAVDMHVIFPMVKMPVHRIGNDKIDVIDISIKTRTAGHRVTIIIDHVKCKIVLLESYRNFGQTFDLTALELLYGYETEIQYLGVQNEPWLCTVWSVMYVLDYCNVKYTDIYEFMYCSQKYMNDITLKLSKTKYCKVKDMYVVDDQNNTTQIVRNTVHEVNIQDLIEEIYNSTKYIRVLIVDELARGIIDINDNDIRRYFNLLKY